MLLGDDVQATTFRTKGHYEVAGLPVDVIGLMTEVSDIIAVNPPLQPRSKCTDFQDPASKRIADVCLVMATSS